MIKLTSQRQIPSRSIFAFVLMLAVVGGCAAQPQHRSGWSASGGFDAGVNYFAMPRGSAAAGQGLVPTAPLRCVQRAPRLCFGFQVAEQDLGVR